MRIWREGTLAQRGSLLIGISFLVLGVIGLIVNPDFGTGSATTAQQWLLDWNGWHAVSTIALGMTALIAAMRARWAIGFQAYNAVVNSVTALWAIADKTPAGHIRLPERDNRHHPALRSERDIRSDPDHAAAPRPRSQPGDGIKKGPAKPGPFPET
jgi:hypothetical protein